MKQQLVDKSSRIEVVDALRGFAVMAILLVHNLEHFIFPVYPENSPGWLNVLDQGVLNSIFALFAGKAYAIFALLFGFTFYMQSNNQKKQGKDFGYRFLWRLALLGVFATWNAAFFPAGDVLLLFVVVGVVLFLTRSWSDRAIGVAAVVLLLQPVEWYHYIANLINPAHRLPDLKVAEMYGEVADYTKAGNWRDFLLGNVTLGQKASFLWAVNAGRFVQTAGLFLLGFFIGRKQLFMTNEKNIAFGTKVLIISAISFALPPFPPSPSTYFLLSSSNFFAVFVKFLYLSVLATFSASFFGADATAFAPLCTLDPTFPAPLTTAPTGVFEFAIPLAVFCN